MLFRANFNLSPAWDDPFVLTWAIEASSLEEAQQSAEAYLLGVVGYGYYRMQPVVVTPA